MSDKPAEKPLIFNEAEQLELQQLQQQNESFNAWGSAISRSLHSGQDTVLVANLLQFLKNLVNQNIQNIDGVSSSAKKRIANEAVTSAPVATATVKANKSGK